MLNDKASTNDPLVLIVEIAINEDSTDPKMYSWTQNYKFDQIYDAAITGRLTCFVKFMNAEDGTEHDMLSPVILQHIGLGTNGRNKNILFEFDGMYLLWDDDGFMASTEG